MTQILIEIWIKKNQLSLDSDSEKQELNLKDGLS
jgi:hypothetical protein